MTTLVFTSTGNCLYVARALGGTTVSIPRALREGTLRFEDDAIGLVFPVYGLSVPPIVLTFLEKAELHTDYLFAVPTYGTYAAGAGLQLIRAAQKRQLSLAYLRTLHMQEDYLPGFAMEKQQTPATQEDALARIASDVRARKHELAPVSAFDRFLTWTHQKSYHYSRGVGLSQRLHPTSLCIGCGACEALCPTGNIKLAAGKPTFAADCLSCAACVQNCPHQALRLDGEKSGARYRNPAVTLTELRQFNGSPASPHAAE